MTCTHHWLLEEPSGAPTVKGRCKRCRKVRHFASSIPDLKGFSIRDQNEVWKASREAV